RWRSTQAIECFLAAHLGSVWGRRGLIRLGQFVHLVTFAPTGAGKSVSVLVPNLLSYVFSCVVVDPKGELYSITAGHRQRKFGHRIVLFDPFGITGREGLSFNPLAFLDSASPDFLDQCRDVANMLIVRTGKEHEPHWNDMAEVVLTCIIAFVCSSPNPDERNLQWVRDIIANPDNFAKAIGHMTKIPHLARLGHQLRWLKDEEQASVMSTLQRQTAWLDSAAIRNHSTTNDFDPLDLRRERATVYLCLPPDRLVTLAPLMRLWIGSILRRVTRGGADERNPLLLLIDEAGHLGHIQALEDAVTLMRGYGIRLWFFFQSMGQLSKAFGERAGVFLDNIDTQQYFGINAIDSADVISRRIGDATITTQSRQRSTSYSEPTGFAGNGPQSGQRSTSSSVTTSEMARRLYKPEEVLRLPADMALLFHKNMPVIPARLIRYYADPEFRDGGTGRSNRLGLGTMLTSVFLL
ncbi:type IV secretory system conjugative DNA transfer family protein, partial [Singulisphaera rosea]